MIVIRLVAVIQHGDAHIIHQDLITFFYRACLSFRKSGQCSENGVRSSQIAKLMLLVPVQGSKIIVNVIDGDAGIFPISLTLQEV